MQVIHPPLCLTKKNMEVCAFNLILTIHLILSYTPHVLAPQGSYNMACP